MLSSKQFLRQYWLREARRGSRERIMGRRIPYLLVYMQGARQIPQISQSLSRFRRSASVATGLFPFDPERVLGDGQKSAAGVKMQSELFPVPCALAMGPKLIFI